jgi:hypothetical protein
VKTEYQEFVEAMERIAELGEDVAWSITKITNETHALVPWGCGYSVVINLPGRDRAIYEKARTLTQAVERALLRGQAALAALPKEP